MSIVCEGKHPLNEALDLLEEATGFDRDDDPEENEVHDRILTFLHQHGRQLALLTKQEYKEKYESSRT